MVMFQEDPMSMRTCVASLAVLVGMAWPGAWALGQGPPGGAEKPETAPFLARVQAVPTPSANASVPGQPLQAYYQALQSTPGAVPARFSQAGWANNVNLAIVTRDPADETLGATLEPVSPALRDQLGIPAGRGLTVTTLDHAGAAFGAGIRDHDILLTLADKPLAAPDDLTKQLKAVGEKEVDLTVLRGGAPRTLKVRPVYRVTLGPAEMESSEYFLGVSVSALDEALRSQLKLDGRTGLLVNEVAPASAAEKAGIKVHDVLLSWHGKSLVDPSDLIQGLRIQEGKAGPLLYLRAGKQATVAVAPEKRTIKRDTVHEAVRVWTVTRPLQLTGDRLTTAIRSVQTQPMATTVTESSAEPTRAPAPRIEALEKEIKAVQKSLDAIRDLLEARKGGGK